MTSEAPNDHFCPFVFLRGASQTFGPPHPAGDCVHLRSGADAPSKLARRLPLSQHD